jgi:hypothetical protein
MFNKTTFSVVINVIMIYASVRMLLLPGVEDHTVLYPVLCGIVIGVVNKLIWKDETI